MYILAVFGVPATHFVDDNAFISDARDDTFLEDLARILTVVLGMDFEHPPLRGVVNGDSKWQHGSTVLYLGIMVSVYRSVISFALSDPRRLMLLEEIEGHL